MEQKVHVLMTKQRMMNNQDTAPFLLLFASDYCEDEKGGTKLTKIEEETTDDE